MKCVIIDYQGQWIKHNIKSAKNDFFCQVINTKAIQTVQHLKHLSAPSEIYNFISTKVKPKQSPAEMFNLVCTPNINT